MRVEADAPLDDLRLVDRNELKKREKEFEEKKRSFFYDKTS